MTALENKQYDQRAAVLAAFGYESLNKRKVWIKISDTHYRVMSGKKVAHYKSLQTTGNAQSNAKV
ncbi:MAG: hypothetical protein ACRCXB_04245 [Aeromonadaceae bacterium]